MRYLSTDVHNPSHGALENENNEDLEILQTHETWGTNRQPLVYSLHSAVY